MARKKGEPIAPAKKGAAAAAPLECAACGAVAPAGTPVNAKHKNCPKKDASGKPNRFTAPVAKKGIELFIPLKAATKTVAEREITVSETKTTFEMAASTGHEDVTSQGYKWAGDSWKKVGTSYSYSSEGHAEVRVWTKAGKPKDLWFGFVQNAPPCDDSCFATFLKESETAAGFIFFITADRGGYCAAYTKLAGTKITAPFVLFMYKGMWSISNAINDAPTTIPEF